MAETTSSSTPDSDDLARAFDAVALLIEAMGPDEWDAPTPCTDWTVRRLVEHVVHGNRVFAAMANGEPRPGPVDDPDLVVAYRESARALVAAYQQPGALERAMVGPFGSATGAERLQIRLYDLLAHGWDLARALGRPLALPDDLAAQSLAFVRTQLADDARSGRFEPARPVAADAPAIDRLAAFLGRDVDAATVEYLVARDGTRLALHRHEAGAPVLWLPGGPMMASAYFEDLGGLATHHPTALLDLRGTGASAAPSDPATYRVDRQVDDVEAVREHLGLDRLDLAAHSAGAALALGYAARHPERVRRLVLLTPSPRAVDVEVSDDDRRELAEKRRGEPWFADAYAAFERIWAGTVTAADWAGITPFMYGRWDEEAQRHYARQDGYANPEAARQYYADGALDPAGTRAALARLAAPVLLIAGEYDASLPPRCAAAYAGLFPHSSLVVLPQSGHYPWLEQPGRLVSVVREFLA